MKFFLRSLHLCFVISVLFLGCSSNETVTPSANNAKKQSVYTPTFSEPKDWLRSESKEAITYTAPEGNARVMLVSIAQATDAQSAAKLAWGKVDPNFNRVLKLENENAPTRGWDAIVEIEYQTSPAEERVVYAYPHYYQNQWSVFLIDANLGTLGKRGAAVRKMYQSLTRAGYQSIDLKGKTAKTITPEIVAELLEFLKNSTQALKIPGAGVGIIQNGEVVYSGGVGVKDIETAEAIDGDTRFIIASNTKSMTTLLLAKLVEQGLIGWDDTVISHYPNFRLGDEETTKSVLIRHLVCACTGLPRKDFEWVFNNGPDTPAQSVFDELAATQPTSGFGELYQYNNQMAAAAGYVAAYKLYPDMELGAAYDRAMQEYIFDRLDMSHTTFDFKTALSGNIAKPYTVNFDGEITAIKQTPSDGFNHTVIAYRPAGGAWSTPTDMLKYIYNELSGGIAPDGKRLFAETPLLERRAPFVETGAESTYGMGLSNKDIDGIAIVEHGGSMAGYLSQMVIIPEANIGAVILTNSDRGGALLAPFGRKLVELLYDAEPKAEAQVAVAVDGANQYLAKERAELTIPADATIIKSLAKTYTSPKLGSVEIRNEGDSVILDSGVWRGPLGSKTNPDGTISLVITDGATSGVEFIVGELEGKTTLNLITPQHKYVLTESD
ncbi:serine hydrolase domain-containing protein [Paraglaciecola arctica]|uniref:serine hydrolase domain-containing protein n=1 Tax=Paraglaciecola arctica TaxID=1128911 RepID=UPI001C06EE8C|nr:serine hydrolase domain-containing protein [Paraglaciecola arctica]MBU3002294.1 beta-lactamase family protein [Paraglaciecola arctica]